MTARRPPKKPAAQATAKSKTQAKPSTPRKKPAAKAAEQAVLGIVNRYDAAGTGRRMRGWNPPNSGPNRAIVGLENIRKRSRDSVRNDWSGTSGVQHWTTNLIGTGIVPRMSRIKASDRKTALIEMWDRWCRDCDADGTLDFYGLQTLMTRAWLESGECFVRLRPRRADSGMEVPLQIQLIESDFVPLLDSDNWPGMTVGNRIRSGIELNRSGQRVAYWVYKEHPGDGTSTINSNDLVRVAKSQMLHVFEPKRPGQLRGVPEFAPVLARLRSIADYDDNTLERMKLANLFAGFVTRTGTSGVDDSVDPLTGAPIVTDSSGMPMVGLEPGTMQELAPGEDVKFANPPEPGTMYHEYMRTQNLGTAAGQGLPYEIMTGDIKEVSDRTLRVVMNEFRRFAEQRQWQIIIPKCQLIRDVWTETAALAGLVQVAEFDDVRLVTWAPQAWPYIHPVQDVQAKQAEVEGRFRSRSSVIGERGDDPEAVDQEIADDQAREKELGIVPEPAANEGATGKKTDDEDNIAPGEYPRNRALDNLTATVARLETVVSRPEAPNAAITGLTELINVCIANQQASNAAFLDGLSKIALALAERPVNTSVNVAAPEVTVEPPNVSVTNEVPAPIVNVAAPNVEITNDVKPADVTVDVNLPERETSSVIERDKNGQIINVTQTERTVQ